MNGEVIKSFLVGLGFDVDESSLGAFNKAITGATVRVTALYAAVQTAAAGIFYGISKISEGFEQMGYEYRIIAPAINRAIVLRHALLSAYQAAGINIQRVVQESVKFNFSLAKTKFALDALYKSVGAKFIPLLTKQMDIFRSKIYQNMPKIQAQLMKFVQLIFKAFEATVILGQRMWSILGRVYDFFAKLDSVTNGWSTKILGVLAAWKLLSLSFLATPLGMVIAGLVAILALYDDFETYKEGGESFFDWGKAIPYLDAISSILKVIWDLMGHIGDAAIDLSNLSFGKLLDDLKGIGSALFDINGAMDKLVHALNLPIFEKLLSIRDRIDNATLGALGIQNQNYFNPANFATPPINPAAFSGINQNVQQQTSITVQGSADANSTGKAVASQQSKVNYDMTKNLKGATR